MASSKIPGVLERRHLVERELSSEQAQGIADAYLAAGRLEEAVVFLVKAGSEERLDQLREEAAESGNVFLLRAVANASGVEPRHEIWEGVAAAARAAGKDLYAETAERLAQRSDG